MAKRSPSGNAMGSHSVRTSSQVWAAAKRRAESEGTTMNAALNELMEGYGRGYINLPKVTKSYVTVPAAPAAPAAQ